MTPFENYKRATQFSVAVLATVFVYVTTIAYPWVQAREDSSRANLAFIATVSGAYTAIYLLIMWIYDRYAWKLFNRTTNYSGYWEMWVTYEHAERPIATNDQLALPYVFHSAFEIAQNPASLSFPTGYSAPSEVWKDLATRLSPTGIEMCYQVLRPGMRTGSALPNRTVGYESIHVTQATKRGKPTRMEGSLHHVALPDINIYRGQTFYVRISRKRYQSLLEALPHEVYGVTSTHATPPKTSISNH